MMDIKLLCLLLQATVLFSATIASSSWQNAIQISSLNNRVRPLSNRIKKVEANPVRKISWKKRSSSVGVTYIFADLLAQATCTAMARGGYINAVRRKCSKWVPTCAVICMHLGMKCFNQLHVYRNFPIPRRGEVHTKGLQIYKFNKCSGHTCGPNFCCCQS